MITEAVRVAVTNNFNCTSEEWAQLGAFEQKYPNKAFFSNSNIKTPQLITVNKHNNKAIITANPDIIPNPKQLARINNINPNHIGFFRVKYVPGYPEIIKLIENLSEKFPVVITLQRFNGKKSLLKYTQLKYYQYNCSRYRLSGDYLRWIEGHVDDLYRSGKPTWICDRKGTGCNDCGLCSKLTLKQNLKISSINLSSSGICPYNCPDCYAKTMQNFLKKTGCKPVKFDMIMQNKKQAGKTKHILNHIKGK